ncbi:UvrD-helicase domain-containing protein [Streptomyces sp. NBC_01136]|uniref:UvrD-helicase domain-containing protein n=1 Tax=unclassified Streptomyces TaxID=2593676 RepID=UPI0032482BFD|nr:UvrD-helicase domain-containing protein [Streptomyces sp. NBC_01136]WST81235.1 UvrD-helicase domain-containing protein [Streptomyces sp. NBC_01136]
MPAPTAEQSGAVDAFRRGDHLVLQAGAGTGKTTTLSMIAAGTGKRGRYIAFNKAIATEASRKFPGNVLCKTMHALAYAALGHRFKNRMDAPRVPGWKTGAALGIGINMRVRIGERNVTNKALSYTVLRTVTRFCQSADLAIQRYHVPRLRGIEAEHLHAQLVDLVLPYADRAWKDLQNPEEGVVRFDHDHYLKHWALTQPRIDADFLLLDEAQDTNPVVEKVFNDQRGHAQLVMVGDSAQAIYGWRGARDVMSSFEGTERALSQSFRFGPALAEEANRWLGIVDAPIRLAGTDAINTRLERVEQPDAILCRSNVGAMLEVMSLLDEGRRVALVGGGESLRALARAARDLKAGKRSTHPELILFDSWGELQEYAEYDPSGRDLLPLVDLVDEHGVDVILGAVDKLAVEQGAEIVVSTAHKAKGREWASVRIGEDFTEPVDQEETDENGDPLPGGIDEAEARLAYVAVTRARHQLDLGGLSWINQHPDGNPGGKRPSQNPRSPSPWDLLGPSPN